MYLSSFRRQYLVVPKAMRNIKMRFEMSVNMGNILLSFSDAIDLANPSISSHQMRTAFIAWQMADCAQSP